MIYIIKALNVITKYLKLVLFPVSYVWHYYKRREKRKDLIIFFKRWCESKLSLFDFLNNNLQSFEREIGTYRFDKLFVPLKEMRICNFKRGYNGNLICSTFNDAPYDKTYIENIIRDVKRGCQDQYLQ